MSRNFIIYKSLLLSAVLPVGTASAQGSAFPGADGAARNVTGGRGGIVYTVTRLNAAIDDPLREAPGTLRYGLNNANFPAGVPRTIVFDVGGTFHLGRLDQPQNNWFANGNGWDTQSRLNIPSNVTIAGQTAPGPGVIITGGVIKVGGSNAIIRNVTVAPGYGMRNFHNPGQAGPAANDFPDTYLYDAFDISGNNVMIDHVSTLYATDESISANELAHTITIQYSNISQGQNYPQADAEASGVRYTGHALAHLLQAGSNAAISVHHNLYAHQKGRLPRVGSTVGTGAYNDFRNNVFYNWLGTGGGGASGQPSFNNFVNNFWLAGSGGDDVSQLPGPDGLPNTADDIGIIVQANGGTGIFNGSNSTGTRVYHAGNLKDTNRDGDANDGVALSNSDFGSSSFQPAPLWAGGTTTYAGVTDTAAAAYDRVLNFAGARWWTRDGVIDTPDERIVHEVRTGTGRIRAWADDPFNADPSEGVEWRTLANAPQVSRPAGFDSDGDGMPDAWEVLHGLNPSVNQPNGDFDNDGYTDVEEYLNELAAWPAPRPIVWAGGDGRYALQANWDLQWQPSRYDVVQVNGGTATIDAVGQHAGTLQIATGATVRVSPSGSVLQTVRAVQAAGRLDLTDNGLVVDYAGASPVASVVAQIVSARGAGGDWTGNGITTSLGDAGGFGLGYGEASRVLNLQPGEIGLFRGHPVDDTSIIVLFTRYGDANLDRVVGIGDFAVLAGNFNRTGMGWVDGDFTYDGSVGIADFSLLAANFNLSIPAGVARVPEPLGVGFFTTALLTALRLRRARR